MTIDEYYDSKIGTRLYIEYGKPDAICPSTVLGILKEVTDTELVMSVGDHDVVIKKELIH